MISVYEVNLNTGFRDPNKQKVIANRFFDLLDYLSNNGYVVRGASSFLSPYIRKVENTDGFVVIMDYRSGSLYIEGTGDYADNLVKEYNSIVEEDSCGDYMNVFKKLFVSSK